MKPLTNNTRVSLTLATVLLFAWTLLHTVLWPLEDYADVSLAYAESTNRIVRGISIGIAGYLGCVAMIFGWQTSDTALDHSA